MHSRYEYGKDVRTDQELKDYNIAGKLNQRICIEQFIIEKMMSGRNYTFKETKEKLFVETDEDIKDYEPDILLITPENEYWIEIKVQFKPDDENVHIKENQIDKLVKMGGYILYSTAKEYFVHSAKYLKSVSNGIIFSNRLYKRCYDIDIDKIEWTQWLHKPKYHKYPRKSYNGKHTSK